MFPLWATSILVILYLIVCGWYFCQPWLCLFILIVYFIVVNYTFPWFMTQSQEQIYYEGMKTVDKILTENDIHYFAICGTLLGAVRQKSILPWDDDCDIGITEMDLEKFSRIKSKFPYDVLLPSHQGCGKIYLTSDKKMYIDVFLFGINEHMGKETTYTYKEARARRIWPGEYFLEKELFPLRRYTFGPVQINGPHHFTSYCNRSWGAEWLRSKPKIYYLLTHPVLYFKVYFHPPYCPIPDRTI